MLNSKDSSIIGIELYQGNIIVLFRLLSIIFNETNSPKQIAMSQAVISKFGT